MNDLNACKMQKDELNINVNLFAGDDLGQLREDKTKVFHVVDACVARSKEFEFLVISGERVTGLKW